MKDDLELNSDRVPEYYMESNDERIREEQEKLTTSKNQYIEILMGAEDALNLI